ncbi:MAG: hypothetical protein ACK55I_08735, partial [bacterium]
MGRNAGREKPGAPAFCDAFGGGDEIGIVQGVLRVQEDDPADACEEQRDKGGQAYDQQPDSGADAEENHVSRVSASRTWKPTPLWVCSMGG